MGQLHELLCRRIGDRQASRCPTQSAFYRVRRALIELTGADRAEVRPGALLVQLLPLDKRREFWRRFPADTGLALPRLERIWDEPLSPWWSALAAVAIALVVFGAGAALVFESATLLFVGLLTALPCILGALMMALSPRWALGPSLATVGCLARCVVDENVAQFVVPTADPDEVLWRRLRGLICEYLGVSEQEVQRDTEFVRDLGC